MQNMRKVNHQVLIPPIEEEPLSKKKAEDMKMCIIYTFNPQARITSIVKQT